jgi:hypothetical protein
MITECAADLVESIKRRNYKVFRLVKQTLLKEPLDYPQYAIGDFNDLNDLLRYAMQLPLHTLSPAILRLTHFPEATTEKSLVKTIIKIQRLLKVQTKLRSFIWFFYCINA